MLFYINKNFFAKNRPKLLNIIWPELILLLKNLFCDRLIFAIKKFFGTVKKTNTCKKVKVFLKMILYLLFVNSKLLKVLLILFSSSYLKIIHLLKKKYLISLF